MASEYGIPRYYQLWGKPWKMAVTITQNGMFLTGKEIFAYVMRVSDGAFYNFVTDAWNQQGSLPPIATDLRKQLIEFQIGGSVSLFYEADFNFSENLSNNTNVEAYRIYYYDPGEFHIIGTEEVVFQPTSLSFSVYEAMPLTSGDINVIKG